MYGPAANLETMSHAVEQTADHVIITDRHGVIQYVNTAFERTTGFSRQEALGRTPRLVKSGQMDPKFFEALWRTILGGEVFRATFCNQKKNGELYYEEKTISPLLNESGEITHFVSVGRDVTERQQAQAAREKLVAELQAALRQVKQHSSLLPICSHCRKIRDDNGQWEQLETYFRKHANTSFSHGICPDCVTEHYGDIVEN